MYLNDLNGWMYTRYLVTYVYRSSLENFRDAHEVYTEAIPATFCILNIDLILRLHILLYMSVLFVKHKSTKSEIFSSISIVSTKFFLKGK